MDQNKRDPQEPRPIQSPEQALEKIDAVMRKVRGFAYEEKLLKDAGHLVNWAKTQESSVSKYRATSLAIEIQNEYGYCDESKSIIHHFKEAMGKILAEVSADGFHNLSEEQIKNSKAILEQVCWVYAGAAITHYWYHENDEGLKWVQDASEVINNYLTQDHKGVVRDCSGLRARLSYYEALLYVQLNDAKNAEEALRTSLKLAKARLSKLASDHQHEPNYWESPDGVREARYTNICIAKILGFVKARIHLLRGELRESEFMLESSQVVLRQAHSPTMSKMISYWLYKVRRAIAGRDEEKLNPIISKLKECHKDFSSSERTQQNRFYATAAAYEVGLSSLYKAQGLRHEGRTDSDEYKEALDTAIGYMDKVGEDLPSPDDKSFRDDLDGYWKFNKTQLKSRIDRETNPQAARDAAEEALMIAEKMTKKIGEKIIKRSDLIAEAYISIGEALVKLDKAAEALNHYNTAEIENDKAKNTRIMAVCYLRKAEAYAVLNQKHEGMRMLEEWELLKTQIESGVITHMAMKAKNQLKDVIGNFNIGRDTTETNLKTHSKRLEEWLTFLLLRNHQKAGDEKPNPKRLSDDMGISLSKAYKLIKAVDPNRKRKIAEPEKPESPVGEKVA